MLLRMARACYPHWRDRRIEREGHRVIPALNVSPASLVCPVEISKVALQFDESDANNESYICFRRREIKAIRKTRTTQVSTTDKLARLKGELAHAFELSRNVLIREAFKRECNAEARRVSERRMDFADVKRKFTALGGRDDEELLFDKERVSKKSKMDGSSCVSNTNSLSFILHRCRAPGVSKTRRGANGDLSSSPSPLEPCQLPKDRLHNLQMAIEGYVKHQKELDHHWEDQIDVSCFEKLSSFLADLGS